MVSRMGLSGAQECGGIKMAGVMVLLVHNKVPLRVEYSGLVQVIVETRPDESCEPCGDQRVGCGRAGFGLHGARRSRKAVRVEGGVEQKMVVEKQERLSQKGGTDRDGTSRGLSAPGTLCRALSLSKKRAPVKPTSRTRHVT